MHSSIERIAACPGAVVAVAVLLGHAACIAAQPAATPPYLLMVTSLDPPLSQLTDAQVALLNDTPFDGVAISLTDIYDGGPLPDESTLLQRCAQLKRHSAHPIWPRVYLNRMVGFLPNTTLRSACRNPEYFDRIKGFDLADAAGARTDFLRLWRLGLRAARALGAPGVVADFESYNLGGLCNPATLATMTGQSVAETQEALRRLGAQLADVVAEEYPEAVIWSLFTGLSKSDWYTVNGQPLYLLHAYLFQGFLQRAAERNTPLRLVSGGELTVGYYSPSREALREKIAARAQRYRLALQQADGRLVLGGTITVWDDDRKLTGWAREAAGAAPPYKCFADFQPLLRELFTAYRHVWLYVPMVTDYNPFDARTAPDLNARLREALQASGWRPATDPSSAP